MMIKPNRTFRRGIIMLSHLKQEEFVQMPLHLQIMFLLNLWKSGEDEANMPSGEDIIA
jgi:hypothetical protein